METVDERSFKEKFKDFKGRVKLKVKQTTDWICDHPVETAGLITASMMIVAETRRIGDRIITAHDNKIGRLTVYCNDIQGRVRLKHELKTREMLELRERMDSGQTKFEALRDMDLIK